MTIKINFGPKFSTFAPNLDQQVLFVDVRNWRKVSLYAISRKTNDSNSSKWRKIPLRTWFRSIKPKFAPPFFFRNLALLVTRYHDQISTCQHVKCQKKLMIQSLENLVPDGQTNRQTDKRTDRQIDTRTIVIS